MNKISMRQALAKELRRQLEKTVVKARDIAEQAAREELQRLGVGDTSPAAYLSEDQRRLRNRLRAHGRQLGDIRKPTGEQGIAQLVTEAAYEHWHRMLFARFLAENNLLMYEDGVTALAIQDCFDLAEEETGDASKGWQYAASYAAKMLPQIFRVDSPVFSIEFAPNHQKTLEQLLGSLEEETFKAQDSLGWVYQFWQSRRKEQINQSEVKIGAKELPAVTQLFTEPYMVSFLLDNALGAWWLSNYPEHKSILPFEFLRTLEDGSPAADKFEFWPKQLSELKLLDPCCGSGHFLVSAFLMLVPMRMAVEGLSAQAAVDAVLSDNIHGLELDPRCVELAAFALALEAWRYPGTTGYRELPEFQLACSGLSINTKKQNWLAKAEGDQTLEGALDQLYELFKQAPTLGSLIDPNKLKSDLFTADYDQAMPLIESMLEERQAAETHEAGIVAQGLAKAASLLAEKYALVITNVPYLSRGKQSDVLRGYCEKHFPEGKNDLATVFLDRCLEFCIAGGTVNVVLPQNWLFLTSYKKFREKLLKNDTWHLLARLGAGAFETISGEVVKAVLLSLSRGMNVKVSEANIIHGVDVSEARLADDKSSELRSAELKGVEQSRQLENPDARVTLEESSRGELLESGSYSHHGLTSGDMPRMKFSFWELSVWQHIWIPFQGTVKDSQLFGGNETLLRWDSGSGAINELQGARKDGTGAWGGQGILVSQMSELPITLYNKCAFDNNTAVIVPKDESNLPAIWCFCSSPEYNKAVRRIDQKLNVTNATLVKVPFDIERWSKVAEQQYPNGLPQPYSNDPTQWIFHGHPCGSVAWDEVNKKISIGAIRTDDTVLQTAVARLLSYRWPAELDSSMELAEEQREWVKKSQELSDFVDDDGIVCLSAVRGEKPAHERLSQLLQAAYSDQWSTGTRDKLLEDVGCKNKDLDFWLREKFFEQHCKLFHHRPFVWHIWDGLKDGFSALVNYHKLDKKNLERLIYTYLDDWIRTQNLQSGDGIDGAPERLAAAETLKQHLERILEGEAPYDIFVRWKPLEEQAIGWNPDLNDGVRLNIRPFMSVPDVGKKGAGILRAKPNIHWKKDRGKDVESAPWYKLGLEYDGKEGDRINDHHLTLANKLVIQKKA